MAKWNSRKGKESAASIEEVEAVQDRTVSAHPPEVSEVSAMTDVDRDAALAEYARNQEARLHRTLEKRKKRFADKLVSQQESQAQVVARQLRIRQLRTEIQERREWIKRLRVEIRDLRPKRTPALPEADRNETAS